MYGLHKALGLGLKEISYKDAMEIDFMEKGINFQREKDLRSNIKAANYAILM